MGTVESCAVSSYHCWERVNLNWPIENGAEAATLTNNYGKLAV